MSTRKFQAHSDTTIDLQAIAAEVVVKIAEEQTDYITVRVHGDADYARRLVIVQDPGTGEVFLRQRQLPPFEFIRCEDGQMAARSLGAGEVSVELGAKYRLPLVGLLPEVLRKPFRSWVTIKGADSANLDELPSEEVLFPLQPTVPKETDRALVEITTPSLRTLHAKSCGLVHVDTNYDVNVNASGSRVWVAPASANLVRLRATSRSLVTVAGEIERLEVFIQDSTVVDHSVDVNNKPSQVSGLVDDGKLTSDGDLMNVQFLGASQLETELGTMELDDVLDASLPR